MKIKARDIVPGWPRGRSTTPSASDRKLMWLYYILFFRHLGLRVPFLCSVSDLEIYKYDSENFNFELKYETTYHQMQQAMADAYRHNPDGFFLRSIDQFIPRARSGEIGRIVGEIKSQDGHTWKLIDV